MTNRFLDLLKASEIEAIHDTSMRILSEIGICFPDQTTLPSILRSTLPRNRDKYKSTLKFCPYTPGRFSFLLKLRLLLP